MANITEVTATRGFAIIGVVVIHSTAAASSAATFSWSSQFAYFLINKMASFAVPAFILLSGFVLCARYRNLADKEALLHFYKNRAKYLLLPYFLWSLLYQMHNQFAGSGPFSTWLIVYLRELLSGGASYHLYFVPLIAQYYLLTPAVIGLLHSLRNRPIENVFLISLTLGASIQLIFGTANQFFQWTDDKSILGSTYLVCFVLGCCLGRYYESYSIWIRQKRSILYGVTLLFLLLHVGKYLMLLSGWTFHWMYSEAIVQTYCILTALSLLELAKSLERLHFLSKALFCLGRYSFLIYISHPLIFILCDRVLLSLPALMFILLSALLGLAVPPAVGMILRKWRWSWILLGK